MPDTRFAAAAALMADPARARMLATLAEGRALTVSELGEVAGVGLSTASGHLAKLTEAGLLVRERQGKHRYLRLSGPDVAAVLRSLTKLTPAGGAARVRTAPRDPVMRTARVCYDHLAGVKGVALYDGLVRRGYLADGEAITVTPRGRAYFAALGIDTDALARARRPLCRRCLDWSERRTHLAGGLGAALLATLFARGWIRRAAGRAVVFTPAADADLGELTDAAA